MSVKLIISDCDGVLTDGHIYVDQYGKETRRYCTHDSDNLARAKAAGIRIILLTQEKNKCHVRRAKKLGLELYETNNKFHWVYKYCDGEKFVAISDSENDKEFLAIARPGYIPANAPIFFDIFGTIRLKSNMGCGCLDEVIRLVLNAQ